MVNGAQKDCGSKESDIRDVHEIVTSVEPLPPPASLKSVRSEAQGARGQESIALSASSYAVWSASDLQAGR